MEGKNRLVKEELLRRFIKGEEIAFSEVYEKLYGKLYGFVKYSIQSDFDAEELTHDVLMKLWEERSSINLDGNFNSFVFTIAKNKIYDFLRKVLSQKKYIESVIDHLQIADNDLENTLNYRETDKVVKRLISQMPEKRREVFELSRYQGKTYKEISKIMSVSENTVDTHIRKALSFLRSGVLKYTTIIMVLLY